MLRFILICIVACSAYYAWTFFPIYHGAGILAPSPPKIDRVSFEKPFESNGVTIVPHKKISGEVRVLAKERYFLDTRSFISPLDILVGWEELSDERNLEHIYFTLGKRYYKLHYVKPPLPIDTILDHLNFWHLVPSTEDVGKELKKIRVGNIISFEGYIIDINSDTSFDWKSELQSGNKNNLNNLILWIEKVVIL